MMDKDVDEIKQAVGTILNALQSTGATLGRIQTIILEAVLEIDHALKEATKILEGGD
jgi:hypothetical protein